MRSGFRLLGALFIATAVSVPAFAAEPGADTVVATVNGEDITLGHVIIAYATLPQQYQQLPIDVLYDGIVEQLVQQTALAQTQPEDLPAQIVISLENERRSLVAANAIEEIMAGAVTEDAVQAAYDAKYKNGSGGMEYDASHILVETEDEAKAIVDELRAGADFAETARAKSTGPSGPRGGALGWFGAGAMVPEFETAVASMEPGQISDPVQTQFGWHVIRLNDTRIKEAPKLEDVRNEITLEIQKAAVDAQVNELVRNSKVEKPEIPDLDPEVIRDLSVLEK